MDLEGKVIQFLGETSGTSKAGNPWKKKEWLLETFGNYPRKVKVQCFGDRADSINLQPGRDYVLGIDIESREFNGRWFTDVSVFRAQERGDNFQSGGNMGGMNAGGYGGNFPPQAQQPQMPYGNQPGYPGGGQSFTPDNDSDEDLPF